MLQELIGALARLAEPYCQRQSKSGPKGSAKCCHFGFGVMTSAARQHSDGSAIHRAGGRPDALAREGQLVTIWV